MRLCVQRLFLSLQQTVSPPLRCTFLPLLSPLCSWGHWSLNKCRLFGKLRKRERVFPILPHQCLRQLSFEHEDKVTPIKRMATRPRKPSRALSNVVFFMIDMFNKYFYRLQRYDILCNQKRKARAFSVAPCVKNLD